MYNQEDQTPEDDAVLEQFRKETKDLNKNDLLAYLKSMLFADEDIPESVKNKLF